jgi:CheY-like chemotaxis protein/signal transduction histidine kinase
MQHMAHRSWLLPVVVLLSLGIFLLDLFTPLGYAVFVFYFLPVVVTAFGHWPYLPFVVATGCSLFSIAGYLLSPSTGLVAGEVVISNRSFAVISVWCMAYLVYRMILFTRESSEREWIKARATALAMEMRGEKNTAEVGEIMLACLAPDIGFKLASLYYCFKNEKEEAERLSFLASFAYQPEQARKTILLGEGLLGQAARDKTQMEVDSLPADYIKVSSALGEAIPRYLLIIPLLAEAELVAVAEFAFTKKPDAVIFKLIQEVSELTAVALRSAQYKEKLAELLQQSQQFAEELQTQQEELRVTNEELEQQSRALKEAAARLENQQAELEQSNQQLEEQAQILENQKQDMQQKNHELTRTKSDLEEQKKQLESSGKYKSEFLANMSHELRTPLNSSLILAKLLSENRSGNLTQDQIKYAQIIYQSGSDLLNIINDVLDLAKVEAGKLNLHPEVLRPKLIMESLEKTFAPQASEKGLQLSLSVADGCPETIISDRQRLEQILKNFISNALKFTEKGSVRLELKPSSQGIIFAVADSGIGIAPEQQQLIFEAFRQADGTINRKFGGTGLGLSISLELARLLGGEINLTSQPGTGSVFSLSLPATYQLSKDEKKNEPIVERKISSEWQRPAQPQAQLGQQEKPTPIKFSFEDDRLKLSTFKRLMLIIEDDENFAKILLDLAHEKQFGAIVTAEADEGIRLAREHLPQAIILDIRLPDHNGLMVLDQLKMDPATRHIPVHVMSGSDFSRSALEMGAAGYMMKPVKPAELQTAFSHLSALTHQGVKHVLVIEDDQVQREHVVSLISDLSVKVDAVATGQGALEKLSSKTYDCMIMDLSLPDISGHELLARISNEKDRYSFPPVIIYTAGDLTREEEEKLRLYAGSIIIKGVKSPERLLSEVTLFLHRVETELPPEQQKMLADLRARDKNLEGRKILLVDDDVRNIFALTSVLENYGASPLVARNGREALEKLAQHKDIELVLMDIMMPEMDGYEAMTRIRQQEEFKQLAIIALTAKAMKDDKEKCLAAGASDYLSKPIDMDKLLSLIRVWLPIRRSY